MTTHRHTYWQFLSLSGLLLVALTACSSGTPASNPSGGPTTVTISKPASVTWVAAQDGSAAWQAISGTTFQVSDAAGKYGVAWVCPSVTLTYGSQPAQVHVLQATLGDATTLALTCSAVPASSPPPYTVSGTLTGVPSGGTGTVELSDNSYPQGVGAFSFQVDAGTYSLLAYAFDAGGQPATMKLVRDIAVTGDVTNLNVDLTSGDPFTMATVGVSGVPSGETAGTSAAFVVSGGGLLLLSSTSNGATDFPAPPSSLLEAGDEYLLAAYANGSTAAGTVQQATVRATHQLSATTTLALPPVVPSDVTFHLASNTASGAPTSATADWGSFAPEASADHAVYLATLYTGTNALSWTAVVSSDWLGSSTTYAYPDFSSTTGWDSSWNIPAIVNPSAGAAGSLGGVYGSMDLAGILQVLQNQLTGTLAEGTSASMTVRYVGGP